MPDGLNPLLGKAERAVADCSGLVDQSLVAGTLETIARARSRLSYPGSVALVAVVGGTGSGKSSLVNALVEDEVAEVGGLRPTTSSPTAFVTSDVDEKFAPYIAELGIDHIVVVSGENLCLVDLPDFDSIDASHRNHVVELVPKADAVIFVTDPEKYRDASLHQLIKSSVFDGNRSIYVLNQADRLDVADRDLVSADLADALGGDGVGDPIVLVTSANPPSGPPVGVDDVKAAIEEWTRDDGGHARLVGAVGLALRQIRTELGIPPSELVADTLRIRDEVSQRMLAGDHDGAAESLTAHLESLATDLGEIPRARVLELLTRVPECLAQIAASTPTFQTRRRSGTRRSVNVSPRVRTAIENVLSESIIDPVGEIMSAVGGAIDAVLAVEEAWRQ